ncbi:MAG TPA: hypothetical protein DHW82_01265 [Spirochaetia bacterium]|nr:hypothetical protein [Spirochaetia bacterium]
MGARFDLDIDIYNDCIKWHLEATNQFSDDKIEYFEQTISDFILNGIPNIAKEVIDLDVLKELNDFIKCYSKNK